ncbi:MAG: SGNH/GDSL hydrolase family protein [Firmicutes bacterium]|nr:SGNH/GDSL hydrolase family protein [Bacillota bacterium]
MADIKQFSEYFRDYPSNTYVGTCNNHRLLFPEETTITSEIFVPVIAHGRFPYRISWCNAVDSTFAEGNESYANLLGTEATIVSAFAGTCPYGEDITSWDIKPVPVFFNGNESCSAAPGEYVFSDEFMLDVPENYYLVFRWTVRGKLIPFTPDKMFPSLVQKDGVWCSDYNCPQPSLIGCRRKVGMKLTFLGDSITMGLGTNFDKYEYWVAKISDALGPDCAVWNLGLGFARATDAATDGVWLEKAKMGGFVSVCLGVNDVFMVRDGDKINSALEKTVSLLREANVPVGIMTPPPFDFTDESGITWRSINEFIKTKLAPLCEYCVDTSEILGMPKPNDNMARYEGHPNAEGCLALANAYIAAGLPGERAKIK